MTNWNIDSGHGSEEITPAMSYQIQVTGEWADSSGGWRPAISGTLNQTGTSDAEASTAASKTDADELMALCIEQLGDKSPDELRIVVIEQ